MPDAAPRRTHDLKCWRPFWEDVAEGYKSFEIRRNDRDYMTGDVLHLREWWDDRQEYTGRECCVRVKYILYGSDQLAKVCGLHQGYVAMGIEPVVNDQAAGRCGR